MTTEKETPGKPLDFIRQIIADDLATGKHSSIVTRFPPEPNGFLHIGHAKSICLNFGVAEECNGRCHLRFDDTNPGKESTEYVESIKRDVHWLGFDWGQHLYYASDYFDQLHDFAVALIEMGKAYVCHLSGDEIRKYRGTLTEPGKESPYRNRCVEENLDLFARMRAGELEEGSCVLRAKIDMASPNIVMRDPVLYRILKTNHHRTGDKWCIYPMYDFPIVSPTCWKQSPTRSAPWSLKTTGPSTTGCSTPCKRRTVQDRLNLRGSTSITRSPANENFCNW
jgi:glutaminyl-tRNA synthetase